MNDSIKSFRLTLYRIIYHSNTPASRGFDLILIILILLSVLTIMLDSVEDYNRRYATAFDIAEWTFTLLFTVEYFTRILIIRRPLLYIFSFYGLIDLLSILPSYLSLLLPGTHSLQIIRILRVLRVFRILKMVRFINQSNMLLNALSASRAKIAVFLFAITTILVVFGSTMYLIEGPENGFDNIPVSIYWAVVTLTTVGFGDITPKTGLGRAISALVMILGYAILAVPTGIFTAELSQEMRKQRSDLRICPKCRTTGHDKEANYCRICGTELPIPKGVP